MESEVPLNVLSVEDEPAFANLLKLNLKEALGATVTIAEDCAAARLALSSSAFDLVTLDYQLPDGDGLELLAEISRQEHPPPVVMVTGHGDEKTASKAIELGADGYVVKDQRMTTLLPAAIEKALEKEAYKRALRESEQEYRELVELSRSIILKTDSVGNITFINRFGCEFFGYSEKELVGKNVVGTIVPEVESTGRDLISMVSDIMTDPDAYHPNLNENVRRDGERAWVLWTNRSIRDESGKTIGTLAIGNDITELKKTEDALKRSEAEYRAVVEDQTELVVRFQKGGIMTFLNDALCSFTGLPREELLGTSFLKFIPEEEKVYMQEQLSSLDEKNPVAITEHRVVLPKGEVHWMQWTNRALFDEQGRTIEFQGVGRDVTERKQAEEALRESEKKYRTLYESSLDGIVMVDMARRITDANQAYLDMLGRTLKEVIGVDYERLTPSKWHEMERSIIDSQTKVRGYSDEYKKEYIRKDGTVFPIELRNWLITDEKRNPTGMWAIVRDITERKQAEQRIQDQYLTLEGIIESADSPIFSIDTDYCYTSFNRTHAAFMKSLYGADIEIGKSILQYQTVEADRVEAKHNVDRALSGNTFVEEAFSGEEGLSRQCFEVSHSPIRSDSGQVVGVAVLARDITERKKAEEALRESEAKFREFADNLPEVVFEADSSGRFVYVNANALEVFGYTEEELYSGSLTVLEMFAEEDREWAARRIQRILTEGPQGSREYMARRKDGSLFPVIISTLPVTKDGIAAGMRGVLTDTTAQKKAEETLRRSEERYRLLADNVADVIWTRDMELNLIYISPSVERLTGYTPEESCKMSLAEQATPESFERIVKLWAEELRIENDPDSGADPDRVTTLQMEERCKDGSTVWVESNFRFLRDKDGKAAGALGVRRDISERKKWEEELDRMNAELKGYAHTVSHDLKSPISATYMVLEMIGSALEDIRLPEEKKEKLDEVLDIGQRSMRRANTLVEDLLLLAEAGSPQDTFPVSIEDTVNNVLAENAARIEEKGITVELGPSLGKVVASPTQIYQIFTNLIRNSIEHSQSESPVIEISNLGVEGTVHRFLVRDNGGGTPEEILDDLFTPFVKGESAGTGIGLSIVEKIVKTYGGEIKAYNDNGACFELTLKDCEK